jgi:hypothetical protein
VYKQVAELFAARTDVRRPAVPVTGEKLMVDPGRTTLVSGLALGGGGGTTVGVMVADTTCPMESATTYFTGEAVPVNVGNGSNVTVPFAFTV